MDSANSAKQQELTLQDVSSREMSLFQSQMQIFNDNNKENDMLSNISMRAKGQIGGKEEGQIPDILRQNPKLTIIEASDTYGMSGGGEKQIPLK